MSQLHRARFEMIRLSDELLNTGLDALKLWEEQYSSVFAHNQRILEVLHQVYLLMSNKNQPTQENFDDVFKTIWELLPVHMRPPFLPERKRP